ncbi:MAG: flagellar biosynthesis protein FlhA [Planctomycetota bacterium]
MSTKDVLRNSGAYSIWGRIKSQPDLFFGVILICILMVILVPLAPVLVDALLIINITISLLVLMRAASVTRPLDFSVFPSLLLVVTFARLSLNIATTRLILGNAAEGPLAAGKVVQTFGSFVGGDNLVVGFVIFTVIVLVQFVVITRGATRVSEVAARFQLDAMPGKQMSIDGDLAAGLIDQESASERRQEVGREADFYGSMDGASKFVRGDAVAGIVIMLVNIIGGLGIGMIYHGMSAAGALEVFGRLTIGDGLVSQVPALMVSIAAALLVTRSASSEQLSVDLGRQVFSSDWILFTAAIFLWLLLPSGLPVPMLLMTSAACGCCGFILRRERIEKEARERTVLQSEELDQARVPVVDVKTLMKVETLELLIGFHLVSLQDRDRGGDLLEHLASMRQKLALELGLHVPSVKVSDSKEIGSREYCFRLRGTRLGTWRIIPGGSLALQKDEERPAVSGELPFDFESSIDLADGSGFWIPDSMEEQAHEAGCQLVSPSTAIALHLEDCITAHAAELLTYERVSQILADLKEKSPSLVDEFVPQTVKIGQLQKVLQDLLLEGVSIRDTETILERIGSSFAENLRHEQVLCEVRRSLARALATSKLDINGKLHAIKLDPDLERLIENCVTETVDGEVLDLGTEAREQIRMRTYEKLVELRSEGHKPILVCSSKIRRHLWKLLGTQVARLSVLAYEEIGEDIKIEIHRSVNIGIVPVSLAALQE